MDELGRARQKKERGFTVQEALSTAADAKNVIVVFETDGHVRCSHSVEGGDAMQMLGMLDFGKVMVINQLK